MNDLFLRACRGERVERPPVWLMRQAGRSLPEYRELRKKVSFVELCHTPELAAEATLQPIDRLGVDAAILFSDILVPAEPLGFTIDFTPGPEIDPPIRSAADVRRLRSPHPEEGVPWVFETIRILRRELDGRVPLIGFAAAPFTLAVYLIEGRGSKSFEHPRRMLFDDPATAHALLERLSDATAEYLAAQIRAGAQAVQLFDTWAGLLDQERYSEFALRYARRVLDRLADAGVPRIYFALDSGHLWDAIADCGADVVGVDWRTPLDEASRRLQGRYVVQGNLDPTCLMASKTTIERETAKVLAAGRNTPGHVFNLGHGVMPSTPVESLHAVVDAVRRGGAD